MEETTLARIAAIIFVAFAMTASVLALREDRGRSVADFSGHAAIRPVAPDPMRRQLLRCQKLGEAATRQADCLKVWAESRRRFLSPSSSAGVGE